jgi:DNA polymerase epsilon subunit 3
MTSIRALVPYFIFDGYPWSPLRCVFPITMQDFEPPAASINRIIKAVLPDNVQITKEARAAFTRAAGIFIFYLTHCAHDLSKENKRSTIQTGDVIAALK